MSNQVEGFVGKIFTKEFSRRGGQVGTAYSFKLEDTSGNEFTKFYQFGFKAPPFKEGDYISFQAKPKNDYADVVVEGSGRVVKNAPARAAQVQVSAAAQQSQPQFRDGSGITAVGKGASGGYVSAGNAREAGFAARDAHQRDVVQPRISYQAARNAAIATVTTLLANDALPASKAATKAGAASRFEEIVASIDKLTVQFYADTETLRLLTTVADAGDRSAPADEEPEAEPAPRASFGEDDPVVSDEQAETAGKF